LSEAMMLEEIGISNINIKTNNSRKRKKITTKNVKSTTPTRAETASY